MGEFGDDGIWNEMGATSDDSVDDMVIIGTGKELVSTNSSLR